MEFSWEEITRPFDELPEDSRKRWEERLRTITPPPLMLEMSAAHLTLESFNPRELSEKAAQDAVLGGKLLAVANSAKFGLASPLTSIQRAVVHLGFNLVKSITVTFMLESSFKEMKPEARQHMKFLRQLSAGGSVLSHKWAQAAELKDPSTVATVALMSRVGALLYVFDDKRPDESYRSIKDEMERLRYEWERWQITTSTLSSEQVKQWGLPEPIPGLILRLWEPLIRQLPQGDDERMITIVTTALLLARHYMDDVNAKPGTLIDQPHYLRLKENIVRGKLLDSLMDVWNNARLQRELAGAVMDA